jgi:hypothetical protein
MRKLLREPLLHFLTAGLGLFLLYGGVSSQPGSDDPKIIEVNRDNLLTFVQYRSRSFEPALASARLDSLQGPELQTLIGDYVREEALYREALALGLDRNDYIIKRRLVQSIEFVTTGFATAGIELSEAEIAAHYEARRGDYYIEPFVTFTHVFFSSERRGQDAALAAARAKLAELNAGPTGFADAPKHGDRFLYAQNYVERDPGFVASHFGQPLADAVFALTPEETRWRGPFESAYGYHLILLVQKQGGRYPAFQEVAESVRADAQRAAADAQKARAIQAIVDTYQVRRNLEIRPGEPAP